jgi:putative photosynthetic complex assembly protein
MRDTSANALSGARPEIVAVRSILFEDKADGPAVIVDASSKAEVSAMKAGEGGFVRSFLRLLVVERRRHDAAADGAFQVTQWNTGRVTITDPTIGKIIELKAFGATNVEAFAQLLETRRKSQ